jgi:hypothetical protein
MASNFKSDLKTGAERYLSQVIVSALQDGWRTPDDFLRHFKPADLMLGLEKAPDLRANLLVKAAGVHERIAKKKSTNSAAEDLRIALDEGISSPADVLELIPPDDRVRYLERAKLWGFLTEDHFWASDSPSAGERAVSRMTFFLEAALGESLLTLGDIADGITFETISTRLPLKELQRVVKFALENGRKKTPLTEQGLLDVIALKDLVGYVPLDHVYKRVLVAKVAQPSGFVAGGAGDDAWPEDDHHEHTEGSKPAAEKPREEKKEEKKAKPEKKASPPAKPKDEEPREVETVSEDELEEVSPGSLRPAAEEEARRKVIERLSALGRLPPRHDDLSTPMLLSIESMYADLLTASTDEAREMCIRDSFPNESHLTTALLALIELLDPSIDVNDPVIRDADADSLIKVVLFEERRRYEQGRSPAAAPPPPGSARRSVPPPLPGGRNGSDEKRAR